MLFFSEAIENPFKHALDYNSLSSDYLSVLIPIPPVSSLGYLSMQHIGKVTGC